MGIYGFAIGVAPAIGPLVSGYIIDSFGWRFIFYILAIITILDVIFAVILITNVILILTYTAFIHKMMG